MPGTAKIPGPFLPTADLICALRASSTDETCLRLSSVAVAMFVRISDFVAALFAIALLNVMDKHWKPFPVRCRSLSKEAEFGNSRTFHIPDKTGAALRCTSSASGCGDGQRRVTRIIALFS